MLKTDQLRAQRSNGNASGAAGANSGKSKKSNKISRDHLKKWSNRGHHSDRGSHQASLDAQFPAFMARLGADVTVQLNELAPSDEDKAIVERCIQELQVTIGQLGTRWGLEIFGSIASGFSTRTSDVDATCVQAATKEGEEDDKEEPVPLTILLSRLSPLFREHPQFSVIEEIASAKVPILCLRFEEQLDIDLSCQNKLALLNTRLLRAYADLDPRVRDLGVAVKIWAKAASICGASQGKLSSYTFTLLVIYFMQVHNEVGLPCLDTTLFEAQADLSAREAAIVDARKKFLSSCHLTIPDLLFRFIEFYTVWFDWGREVASTRLGERRFSNDGAFQALRGRFVSRIHVEDPFCLQRNLHCVLGDAEEVQLREAFQMAWQSMLNGYTPVGLRPSSKVRKERLLSGIASDGSPLSSPAFGPAVAPELEVPRKADVSESPGALSSAESTKCGDGDGASSPLEACSSGEYQGSDEEGMDAEYQAAAAGPKQWWHSLCSTHVQDAVRANFQQEEQSEDAQARKGVQLRVLSLEAVENEIVQKQRDATSAAVAQSPADNHMGIADKVKNHLVATACANAPEADGCQQRDAKTASLLSSTVEVKGEWWRNLGSAEVVEAVKTQDGSVSTRRKGRFHRHLDVDVQEHCPPEDLGVAPTKGISSLLGGSFAANASSIIAARLAKNCFGAEMIKH